MNDVTIHGNLLVNGTTTTVNTTNLEVDNTLIELNGDLTGEPINDAGVIINRGSETNAFMGWIENTEKFFLGTTLSSGSTTGDLTGLTI